VSVLDELRRCLMNGDMIGRDRPLEFTKWLSTLEQEASFLFGDHLRYFRP